MAYRLQVTTEERLKAAAQIGGDVAALTVAFGRRVPESPQQQSPAAGTHGRSLLELELEQVKLALVAGMIVILCRPRQSFMHMVLNAVAKADMYAMSGLKHVLGQEAHGHWMSPRTMQIVKVAVMAKPSRRRDPGHTKMSVVGLS